MKNLFAQILIGQRPIVASRSENGVEVLNLDMTKKKAFTIKVNINL